MAQSKRTWRRDDPKSKAEQDRLYELALERYEASGEAYPWVFGCKRIADVLGLHPDTLKKEIAAGLWRGLVMHGRFPGRRESLYADPIQLAQASWARRQAVNDRLRKNRLGKSKPAKSSAAAQSRVGNPARSSSAGRKEHVKGRR